MEYCMHPLLAAVRAGFDVLAPKILGALLFRTRQNALQRANRLGRPSTGHTMPPPGRYRAKRIIVGHQADTAGPHTDLYIAHKGKAYNVGVKRLPDDLPVNNDGRVTQAGTQAVLERLRNEYSRRGWLAASGDHTEAQAKADWYSVQDGPQGYGSGPLRQVLSEQEVEVVSDGQRVRYVDWEIDPHKEVYAFKIMKSGDRRSTDILAVGFRNPVEPKFLDRLHLKLDAGLETFLTRLGDSPVLTVKEDGASCYVQISPSGLRAWSPRTHGGQHIEYTPKLGALADVRSTVKYQGMAELLFRRPGRWARDLLKVFGAESVADSAMRGAGGVATVNEIAGILNAHRLPPAGWRPEMMVYRVDNVGRADVAHQAYEDNLVLCKEVATLHPALRPPTVITALSDLPAGAEGVVGVPRGTSIMQGRKWKALQEGDWDWRLDTVGFSPGSKGGVQGVCHFTSLESGKQFKMGASAMGSLDQARDMLRRPQDYEGRVYRVSGFLGHEGRAPRVVGQHLDKGVL